MLKELRLTNIVLIEKALISFETGFNILSGESGSGKSAIMNALNLLAGERSDSGVIRRSAEKAVVEASFDIETKSPVLALLESSGIYHESGSELILRRELSSAGKSRAFINDHPVQLTLLRQVSEQLFHVVGQHANQKLLSLDYHRFALDAFGDILPELEAFSLSWQKENETRRTLEQLIQSEAERLREIERCQSEIEELQEACLQEEEEEALFEEYTQLSNADELAQKAGELTRMLSGEKSAVLTQLIRHKLTLEQLSRLSPSLAETVQAYENALLELQEISRTLTIFESRIEHNPERASTLNQRLELIAKLKRKYGPTIPDALAYLSRAKEKLATLENADQHIETLQTTLKELEKKNNTLCSKITTLRRQAAKKFEVQVKMHLQALNMTQADFKVTIEPQKRTQHGDDKIEFMLTPNLGEHCVSLRECASGGELSRTMLAVQAVLSGKEKIPTLIFDEIDANIGGETATVVGEKLCEIAAEHQVLCITHFPQVAKLATHHLRISKREVEGRTITLIDILDQASRKSELVRMRGEGRKS